jgi:hypothetical protein
MKLITSGCSFADNIYEEAQEPGRWPQALSSLLSANLINKGQGSAGNDWIARSIIYEVSKALKEGTRPEEMLVLAMWSSMSRSSIFVSKEETVNYEELINWRYQPNPVSFIDYRGGRENGVDSGWAFGSITCRYRNEKHNAWREIYNKHFFSFEGAYIQSLEKILMLQLFLQQHGIKFMFMTYAEILHPYSRYKEDGEQKYVVGSQTIPERWPSTQHLWDQIDFSQWLFWKNGHDSTLGFYEFCTDSGLPLETDQFHPSVVAHRYYAKHFLLPNLIDRGLLGKEAICEPAWSIELGRLPTPQ